MKKIVSEMPDRAERMHCSHGEGSPAFAARRAGAEPASPRKRRAEGGAGRMKGTGRGGAGGEPPEQTDWRDWGLEGLPDDPAERAREAEVRLAEALAVLVCHKHPAFAALIHRQEIQGNRALHCFDVLSACKSVHRILFKSERR